MESGGDGLDSPTAIASNHGARRLDTSLLLRAYSAGLFPMADARDADDVFWVEPRRRGILPIAGFHLSRSLARTLKRERFRHTRDMAFDAVIRACAAETPGRPESWINGSIADAYVRLHAEGHAHSIETWDEGGRLVGGLYGVRIGAAFFGESMFSRATDSSKAALAHLMARLAAGGFRLLDTQFLTAHLASFGGVEVKRAQYLGMLADAISHPADWGRLDALQPSGVAGAAGVGVAGDGVAAGAAAGDRALRDGRARVAARGADGPSGKCIVQLLSHTS